MTTKETYTVSFANDMFKAGNLQHLTAVQGQPPTQYSPRFSLSCCVQVGGGSPVPSGSSTDGLMRTVCSCCTNSGGV